MLLNLVSASNASDPKILWGFISKYDTEATVDNNPVLDKLVSYAIRYYHDFIEPHKSYRKPTDTEKLALEDLKTVLQEFKESNDGSIIQEKVFEIGMKHGYENLRDWFACLYETLLGQTQGPRMGSFIALYGVESSIKLIEKALK
jgi:lysyl-tRNA synthetase class 1